MSKPHLTKDFWLGALRAEGDAFRAAVTGDRDSEATLGAAVPSCPEWTVADLVRHVTMVQGWVRRHVTRGETSKPERWPGPGPEVTGTELVAVWVDEFAELLATLDALDPDLPAWNWAPQAKRASFWHRRMAHEAAVHRWDAQMATGLAEPIEAKLAADGVTEVLDSWLPSGRRRGPTDRAGMIALHATDMDQIWYVRLRGPGIALLDTDTLLDDDDRHERATASGPASDLVLALYGRVPFDTLLVTGDAELLEGLRTG
jgi:uncharacterized protein (TIGR03083 family)